MRQTRKRLPATHAIRRFCIRGILFALTLAAAGLARAEDRHTANLIELLKSEDVEAKLEAIETLGRMRAAAKPAVPSLILLFRDGDVSVEATQTLAYIGRDAIQPLLATVKDRNADPVIREGAISALALLGSRAADAVKDLTTILQADDEPMKCEIVETLGCIGPPAKAAVPSLHFALKSRSPDLRLTAAAALWKIDRDVENVVPSLVELLESYNPQEVDKNADQVFPEMYQLKAAVWLLGEIGPEAKSAIPVLIKVFKEGDEHIRDLAAEALGKIGPDAKSAVPVLLTALAGSRRSKAVSALNLLGRDAIVGALTLFDGKNVEDRELACYILSEAGPNAKPFISHLVEALRDKNPNVRISAAGALGRLAQEPRQTVPALAKRLDDSVPAVRAAACSAIGAFHGSASEAVPSLIKALSDSNAEVRARAADSLGMIGSKAAAAAPALKKMIDNDDHVFPYSFSELSEMSGRFLLFRDNSFGWHGFLGGYGLVVKSGWGIGGSSSVGSKNTCKVCLSGTVDIWDHAIEALSNLGPDGKIAIPAIIELIRKRQDDYRYVAIWALERMGPAASSAVPTLIEALPDYPSAATALARIAPDDPRVKGALLENYAAQAKNIFAPVEDRLCLARALRRYGPVPSDVVSVFSNDLISPDDERRVTTALSVLEVDPPNQRAARVLSDALKQHLSGGEWDYEVAETFSRLGPLAKSFIPILREDLNDPDQGVRIDAMRRLAILGRDAEPALPDLIGAMIDAQNLDVESSVLQTLADIGRPAVKPLIAALGHDDVRMRSGAARALGMIGPGAAEAVPALIKALQDRRPDVRAAAAAALDSIEPGNANLPAALAPLLNDEYYRVRENARLALDKMMKKAFSH